MHGQNHIKLKKKVANQAVVLFDWQILKQTTGQQAM